MNSQTKLDQISRILYEHTLKLKKSGKTSLQILNDETFKSLVQARVDIEFSMGKLSN